MQLVVGDARFVSGSITNLHTHVNNNYAGAHFGKMRVIEEDEKEEQEKLLRFVESKRPETTTKTYDTYKDQYNTWCEVNEARLTSPVSVARFLVYLSENNKKASTVNLALSAVCDSLKYTTSERISLDVLVKDVRAAINRGAKEDVKKAIPLTTAILEKIFQESDNTFQGCRDRCYVALSFFGELRASDAANLLAKNASIQVYQGEEVLILRLVRSKTDQAAEGAKVVIASLPVGFCPVKAYKAYIQVRDQDCITLFHQAKKPEALKPTSFSTIVKNLIEKAGIDPQGFSSHSGRRGGATAAFNAGVNREDIKRHGRWKSDAVDEYIEVDMDRAVEVTKTMIKKHKAE